MRDMIGRLTNSEISQMTYHITINHFVMDANRRTGTNHPPISFRKGATGRVNHAHSIRIDGDVTIRYEGDKILIQTEMKPVVLDGGIDVG